MRYLYHGTKAVLSLLAVLTIFQFTACKKDEKSQPEPPVVIAENTILIDISTWQNCFISMDSSTLAYTFKNNISSLNVKVGDVIVSGIGEGLIRRVTSIDTTTNVVFQTEQATLTEVFKQASISLNQSLTFSKIKSIEYHYPGVKLDTLHQKNADQTLFTWNFNSVIYDLDNNLQTTNDQVKLAGDFSCNYNYQIKIDIGALQGLKEVKCGYISNQNSNLNLTIGTQASFSKEIDLATVYFAPVTVIVGILPVVFVPKFEIKVGAEGNVNATVTTGVKQSLSFDAGIQYLQDQGWSFYKENNKSFNYVSPQVTMNAGVQSYIKPELTFKIYGVAGPYANVKLFGKLDADLLQNPWWKLVGGMSLNAGAKAQIFDKFLFDYTISDLINYEVVLAQAEASFPTLTTTPVSNIAANEATSGGNITSDGGGQITSRGVCWSTSPGPTTAGSKSIDGAGVGSFSSQLTSLVAGTTYYIRAYATNSAGTAYGNEVVFTTTGGSTTTSCPGVSDVIYSGQTYHTVQISDQCWLKENLNIGAMVVGTSEQLDNGIIEKYCFNNDPANCDIYGGLYQWNEMLQYSPGITGICPVGWHIPTYTEWSSLMSFLQQYVDAGGKMKETGFVHWDAPNEGATNWSGFTALGGGFRASSGFLKLRQLGDFWSSTQVDPDIAHSYRLFSFSKVVDHWDLLYKYNGLSVRCIKN